MTILNQLNHSCLKKKITNLFLKQYISKIIELFYFLNNYIDTTKVYIKNRINVYRIICLKVSDGRILIKGSHLSLTLVGSGIAYIV